jgi:hypothetical protein
VAGFGGCFLVKKQIQGSSVKIGSWDSMHVVSVDLEKHDGKVRYSVTTTVFLKMISSSATYGNLEIAGNLTRRREDTVSMDPRMKASNSDEFHISNIGRLIEANESEIRQEMDAIYINKTR